ncbi:Bug family tripartite tricarboxylate transporter substrate binding protein [Bordetella petrii]|uniref:Bug family tripartite tricarboxylate transporter substrate binding protein n=1 Tax=Bordetella petrii TaxID=94624 RepID=UPI001E616CEA|nr:tripartite tricarboxylate transporter substrate binding protein [Bordetella petrii]MCD0504187.1 tripartite tricarboxylate transporter substrate binding protein [Bordetella petrii]
MSTTRRRLLGAAAALPALSRVAWAQSGFPARPIRLVVGFAPGGLTDLAARALAERMSKVMQSSVVVENRPGGQTIIATTAVARAAPDGYTLAFAGTNGMILNPLLYNNLPYQRSDFRQLGSMGRSAMLLIVHPDLGVNNVQEFIALAKQKPGQITSAHAGRGVINHLALLHFQSRTGTQFQDVPYKGSGPALIDLMAGTVQSTFDFPTSALPHIRAGKLKVLAVTADQRLSSLPDVPTMKEAGVDDFELYTRMMISGPAAMPEDVVRTLESAVAEGARDPSLVRQFAEQGVTVEFTPGKELDQVVERESAMWAKVIDTNQVPKVDLKS